jgi:hypothetical protein
VIKYMLQNPIMSGRIGKWAYTLIECDETYESLKSMKDQVVVDFIVEHRLMILMTRHVLPYLSGTIIRGTLKAPNSQLVTPISIKLQRLDGCD